MSDDRVPEPPDGDERDVIVGWLAFHRDAFSAKCDGVADDDLIRTGLGGTTMSLLGLMRHLTEMERVYGAWALAGGGDLEFVYGPYEEGKPDGDFDELTVAKVAPSLDAWQTECAATDRALGGMALDDPGNGNRHSVRWNLVKLVQEYARHNGHADLIRQSIDGATGE
ncbi:MAG TPA: DinB family protein [Ilumatobacteraceae bacterium]|nr:DinB family protein [Ilumatobacteraceae bacterium]